ncbi:MAG: SLBB domain-containing protein [Chloroherpetonaceae bacterium]|nr:SLBB domain-containing protein [Chloroherpetonaceae bacterium]
MFGDQSNTTTPAGESRSLLLKNYFSSFNQDQSPIDRLSNSTQASPVFPSFPLEGVIDPSKYLLGSGDIFEISVASVTPVIFRVSVNVEGKINIPNVGSFEAAGRYLSEIKPEIILKLKRLYKDEAINVSLSNPRSFIIAISGAVKTPGKYVVSSLDRLDKVILQSNISPPEPTQLAPNIQSDRLNSDKLSVRLYPNASPLIQPSLRHISIRRKNGSVFKADLLRFYLTGDRSTNPNLQEGDVVTVQNAAAGEVDKIGIYGAVQIPLICEYHPSDSLLTLFSFAQGGTQNADLEQVQLVRENNGTFESKIINLTRVIEGKEPNFPLLPNDRIQVPEKKHKKLGNITIKGEVKYPGYFSIHEGETTLKQVITLAGGFTENALLNGAKIFRKPKPEDPNAREPISVTDPGFERARIVRGSNLSSEEAQTFDLDFAARRNFVSANFNEIFSKESNKDIELLDGDVVIIPKDDQTVYIVGQVQRPGFIKYRSGWKVEDYILAAGGETSESSGDVKIMKAGSDEWKNPGETIIESGDWIIAPKRVRKTFSQVLSEYSPILSLFATVVTLGVLIFQVTR